MIRESHSPAQPMAIGQAEMVEVTTSSESLPTPLVACPLCGHDGDYLLTEGSTYRWWLVQCKHCGGTVSECGSDRRAGLGTTLPDRWPLADEAWNQAGAHAQSLRLALAAIHHRVCHGSSTHGMGEAIAIECETALPALRTQRAP